MAIQGFGSPGILAISLFSALATTPAWALTDVTASGTRASNSGSSTRLSKVADNGMDLRALRRVGLSTVIAGAYGSLGFQMDLNFTPETGVLIGYGLGDQFTSFSFQVKRMLGGRSVMPYAAIGYASWYSGGSGRFTGESPGFFGDKFLDNEEKMSGRFSESLIFPSVGLQYTQLSGPYAGVSVFLEAQFLFDIDNFVSAPNGALGVGYFF
jgi:hypothetical protein